MKLEAMAQASPQAGDRARLLQSSLEQRNLPVEIQNQIKENLSKIYLDDEGNPVAEGDLMPSHTMAIDMNEL